MTEKKRRNRNPMLRKEDKEEIIIGVTLLEAGQKQRVVENTLFSVINVRSSLMTG